MLATLSPSARNARILGFDGSASLQNNTRKLQGSMWQKELGTTEHISVPPDLALHEHLCPPWIVVTTLKRT
jgi:hypothetical protein